MITIETHDLKCPVYKQGINLAFGDVCFANNMLTMCLGSMDLDGNLPVLVHLQLETGRTLLYRLHTKTNSGVDTYQVVSKGEFIFSTDDSVLETCSLLHNLGVSVPVSIPPWFDMSKLLDIAYETSP